MLPPVLSYDESVIQVLATGSLKPGITDLNSNSRHELDLRFRCMMKTDAYINIVFPIKNSESISFIVRKSCKQALEPLSSMKKESQEAVLGTKQSPPRGEQQNKNPERAKEPDSVDDRAKHNAFFSVVIILGLLYAVLKLHNVTFSPSYFPE